MTERLYLLDGYLREFDAVVTQADAVQKTVILDRTAFFPGGGGQPADAGTLAQSAVVKMHRSAGEIEHVLDGGLPAIGDRVHGILDWDRRYSLMRTHTAMHILCGVVFRDYGALVTGGEMERLHGRMDFEFERMERSLVAKIEKAVNEEVTLAREICVRIVPREQAFEIPDLIRTKVNLLPPGMTEVRTVEIVGLDLQADGGTHVLNTREVGTVRIVDYKSKGAANKRIYLELE